MSILCGFLKDENNHLTKLRAVFQNFSSFGLASLIIRYSLHSNGIILLCHNCCKNVTQRGFWS
ncbi:hypothetical protein D7W34_20525 [Escherichia coli]|nr:hypothetical protein CU077_13230 [Escherichia coli]EFO2219336.1 hypothetical protein [Escherichia coli O11]ESD79381.1 hypothetical protein HMPREF1608_00303 [Escherichia coli 908525]AWR84144.1 hypothetical protein B9T59_25970 [Escherichia coli]AWT01595.1 hypothetical protein BEN53_11170 [Escherichia coli]